MRNEIKVSIDATKLDTIDRVEKAKRVAGQLKKIVNSIEFAEYIMKMPTDHKIGETSEWANKTNIEILRHIQSGKEEWNSEVDNEIDLIVEDYTKKWSKVVGYITPGKPTIYVNTKFFDTMDDKRVGSNFLHEYGHTLGFRHGGNQFKESIPYYLNKAYEHCYDRIIRPNADVIVYPIPRNTPESKGNWVCKRLWYTLWIMKRCKWVAA